MVQLQMFGLIRNDRGSVRVANRIFETMLYNLFLSEEELKRNVFSREGDFAKNRFVSGGKLNMRLILEKFIETYIQVFGPLKDRFKEKDGREQFLLYLKPIINGTGNYYIEAQTRDQTRTDVIVDYLGQQYIFELKIWRGERYNAEGEKQILDKVHFNKYFAESPKLAIKHHECLNGKGYPNGLTAEDLNTDARIIAVADAYSALTSDRAFRKAMSKEQALTIMKQEAGTKWDPIIVDALYEVV